MGEQKTLTSMSRVRQCAFVLVCLMTFGNVPTLSAADSGSGQTSSAAPPRKAETMPDGHNDAKPVPIVRALSSEEISALEKGLDLAARLADAPRPLDITQVQRLYDDYLDEEIDNVEAIIALGLAFGDVMRRQGNLVWARVIDEYGEETCVAAPHKVVYSGSISMIQKRLARKEKVNLAQLSQAVLDEMAKQVLTAATRE